MKKKIWVSSPLMYVMLLFAALLITQNYWLDSFSGKKFVLIAECVAVLLIAIASFIYQHRFRRHIHGSLQSALNYLSGGQVESAKNFPLPVALIGERGDLIWGNRQFDEQVFPLINALGRDLPECLGGQDSLEFLQKSTDVTLNGKNFTIYSHEILTGGKNAYLFYFVDNTDFQTIKRDFERTRLSVAIASFDNLEELSQMAKPGEMTQISAQIEMKLMKWVSKMGGFVNRIQTGKYLVIWDRDALNRAIELRFDLLDQVREIQLSNRVSATLSMGVSVGGNTVRECYETAERALDMALGRGGDQAVVRLGSEYKFFGGVSKGVEKRSRVRSRVVANALASLIENSSQVMIMGHRNSDLDCLGAAVGLRSIAVNVYHKPTHIVVDENTTLAKPLIHSFQREEREDIFFSPAQALSAFDSEMLLIIVDTHSGSILESRELYETCKQVVVIDHHRKMVDYIDRAVIFYHEPYASSASEMVTELVEYLAENNLNQSEADALLSGIMLDTKNFVLKTGVRTFEAAAYLRRRGADTVEVKRLFASSFDSYQQKYSLIAGAKIHQGMAITQSNLNKDLRIEAAQAADELLNIQGVDASFVLFVFNGKINISARSFGRVNVQLIMEKIGGGGHLTMAGAQLSGTMEEACERLKKAIDTYTEERGVFSSGKSDEN